MIDLTEQWKKGKLPEGWYYVKDNRAEGIYAYTAEYLNIMYRPRNGERIIEQVPSYEEWKDLKSKLQLKETVYDFDTARLEEENAQLKELLKECKEIFDECFSSSAKHGELYKQIDEALR